MTKAEENRKNLKIKLLEARQKSYYSRIKKLQDVSIEVNPSNPKDVQRLLDGAANLSQMRSEFNSEFDELNLLKMELNPELEPDMTALECFENIFVIVQGRVNALSNKNNNNNGPSEKPMQKMKLPPIELPRFSGDAKAWRMFIECYNSIIHQNMQLSNSEKVYYLCGQLSGRALECVAGITPTGDNYALIYETLTAKFEDVRSMATAYLDEIINLKKLQHASVDGLNSFIDKFSVSVAAFQRLDIPSKLDFVFLHLALKRVDSETARLFENSARHEKIPSYDSFAKFVKEQAKIIERTGVYAPSSSGKNAPMPYRPPVPTNKPTSERGTRALVISCANCPICKGEHGNFSRCSEFLKLSAKERFNAVKQNGGCVLCLSFQHKTSACNIKGNCNTCQAKTHHTLLHFIKPHQSSTSLPVVSGEDELFVEADDEEEVGEVGVTLCSMQNTQLNSSDHSGFMSTTVLLATARVRVVDSSGTAHLVRCLIDSGSQNHFITKQCCDRLALTPRSLVSPMVVNGFGGGSNPVIGETELEFFSRFDRSRPYKVRPLVVDAITQKLPTARIDRSVLSYLKGAPLADDTFDCPGEMDMLIGAQLFSQLMLTRRICGPPGRPDAMQTTLGFILMGDAPVLKPETRQSTMAFCAFAAPRLDEVVRSFWELEEVASRSSTRLSREDQECEQFYQTTTTRDETGRYTVALPFKSDAAVSDIGNSMTTAEKRFLALEKKMKASYQLRNAYDKVMEEYLQNDYIEPIPDTSEVLSGYVIPHHGVIRNDKVTTKLRVVMDASARTDKHISLNQMLHAGPNLQGDIFRILLNFRLFPIAFCADVRQMYLQIKMAACHRKYLRILYRFDPSEKLQLYEFKRLCFGLSVSPFLALRTMHQLCADECHDFPLAVEVVRRDLYMDDIVSSEKSAPKATEISQQLINLFKAGGFDLMKWSSNSKKLLSQLPVTHLHPQVVKFDDDAGQKILGVKWDPRSDMFSFELEPCRDICTKRNILSTVARLWDILGFAAPVILYAKLIIQELWNLKLDWDAVPPEAVIEKWNTFQQELPLLAQMTVPRHIGVSDGTEVTLLAFSDASEKAYGAAVYLHIKSSNGIVVNLLCAKSRVAPLKSVTLARLELCGALLLSKLVKVVLLTYEARWKIQQVVAFTDSTVTLHWIHSSPHRWKTFVANRVAQIQENLDPECFYHISGKENPSDCLSRGLTPAQLLEHPLWLKGPPWMSEEKNAWPIQPFKPSKTEVPEAKPLVVMVATRSSPPLLYQLAQNISSWPKVIRIVAYILRFIGKLKTRGPLNLNDLEQSELAIIRALQTVYFSDAIEAIRANKPCSKSLQKLRPILVAGILRVGGRLEQANITFDHKHPILLPRKDHIVNIIIDNMHRNHCHTGPHLLLCILRQRFWILSGRNLVRSRVHACNVCFRVRPKPYAAPVMANLPESRLQVTKPFAHTGVDYCGPFNITWTRRRGVQTQKAYVCVFICLTTRAVHVEISPDMSTDSFLNALKRFLARRGPVQKIMSDHGTNFVGARSYLKELYAFLKSAEYTKKWSEEMSNHRIDWQMIPPNAPHFGGGWESAVKAFKAHLIRVMGAQILTYEEFLTVLCQIEAVLNSRPLGIVLSPDPSEPVALTPAHFLHMTPLSSIPSAPVEDDRTHLLNRYLLLDQLVQSYWRRWSIEYLHNLQTRSKWLTDTGAINRGTVVLLMKNNTAPLHWPLGIIQETYPGCDRKTRVVLVKTKSGTFMRPVIRLCPLPTQ